MADIIKDANYYYNRAAQARANGNERLAQMMENYAIQMDRDYGTGANGRDGYTRPVGRYEDAAVKGWNVGASNQRYANAEKQAEQARLQAMYENGVRGGAISGEAIPPKVNKPSNPNFTGYSGVGDPEAQMQADYMAKRGGQAYVEPGRGGYGTNSNPSANATSNAYNVYTNDNGVSYDPNGQARPGAQPIGFRYVDGNGQTTDYPLVYYDKQGVQIPDSTVNMVAAANPTYWAGQAGQAVADNTTNEELVNAASANPIGWLGRMSKKAYDFVTMPKGERYPGLHGQKDEYNMDEYQ